jgi:hypothetical protein
LVRLEEGWKEAFAAIIVTLEDLGEEGFPAGPSTHESKA